MMNESIRELMDSCRPREDDLLQPEMQPLANLVADDTTAARQLDRSQALDLAIKGALHEVPVPAGLQQRLLTAVSQAESPRSDSESPTSSDQNAPPATGGSDPSHVQLRPSPLRSWRLVASLTAAAAVLVLIPLVISRQSPTKVDAGDLTAAAFQWSVPAEGWISGKEIWTVHPLPDEIVLTGVKGRQKVRLSPYRVTASCYDLNHMPAGTTARVYVFAKPKGFQLPAVPPRTPRSTAGKCVAAWTDGTLVYVMVVEGREDHYEQLIRRRLVS